MSLNDNSVVTAAKGYVYIAPVGTANPTAADIAAFDPDAGFTTPTGWENVGHTSRDDLPEFGFDGGDPETKGSWQNEALRTVVSDPAVDSVTINLLQVDEASLGLYYGTTDSGTDADGEFAVNDTTGKVQKALLIVLVDGENKVAFYAPKTEIRRSDALSLAVDDFTKLPIKATLLKQDGSPLLKWIAGYSNAVDPTAGV